MPERPRINPAVLRTLRLDRCHSQASLAKLAKLGERTILRLELGQHDARLSTIRKLAKALNVSLEQLTAAS